MRASLLFACGCLSLALAAQPVLQYDNVDLYGSVYDLYAVIEPGDSDFELEGPDADWDFNTSVVDLFGGAIFGYPDLTPFGGDYPDAELALTVIDNTSGNFTYSYYDLGPGGISVLAEGVGGGAPRIYSDPSTILQFPFSYGQAYTDDHVLNGSPFSFTRTYSGYGTLDMVTGITDNVVKVTASNNTKSWYRSDPVEPLFTIDGNGNEVYWERITIGMAEQRGLVPMAVAPNPASTFFRIPGLDASASYRVIDALGQETIVGRVAGGQETIDISELRPGMYRVVVHDAHGTRTASLMKD